MIGNIVSILKAERSKLDAAIHALEGSSTTTQRGPRRRRHMSADARARISKMMKKRWAERKAKKAA